MNNFQNNRVEVAIYQKAKNNNFHCGDSYFYRETENEFICVLVDGLGSGEPAKKSSQIVINIIKNNPFAMVEELVERCNEQLVGIRGVVLGILKIDFNSREYIFSSIGNIGLMMVKDCRKKRNIPSTGYLAGYHRPLKVIREKLEVETNFIMFSDGVSDVELTQKFFLNTDVYEVVEIFASVSKEKRMDDTTLIAMRYEG